MSGESTLQQYNELAGLVALGTHPIMPRSCWGQDVAYLGANLDYLVALNKKRYTQLADLKKTLEDFVAVPHDLHHGEWIARIQALIDTIIIDS